jgi:hypothetical protein
MHTASTSTLLLPATILQYHYRPVGASLGLVHPGASLPQIIYEHSIEASYRGEVLTLVNSELPIVILVVRY